MSVSGSLLILALLFIKRLWKDKISRQWQYYIWLPVLLRLLLPFSPQISLLGKTYLAADQAVFQSALLPQQDKPGTLSDIPASEINPSDESISIQTEHPAAVHPFSDIGTLLLRHIWLVWLTAALGLLIRKITAWQSFMRYVHAGTVPVCDIEMLDRLSSAAKQAGIRRPAELGVNPMLSSPMLTGFFHPCIVLTDINIPEKDFVYTVLHELIHLRRLDLIYKWLVQAAVCLHWFNPLVHLMSREISRDCEFSCDEAVLTKIGPANAPAYGKTLLDAMAAAGRYQQNSQAVTLNRNKRLLKERLGAIMNYKRKTKAVRFLTGVLTLCMISGACFAGVYPVTAASRTAARSETDGKNKKPAQPGTDAGSSDYASLVKQYYKAGSIPLFQTAFSRLDEKSQNKWMNQIYKDDRIMFWSAAAGQLEKDGTLIQRYAKKAYADENISYFSVLIMHMSKSTLKKWLDKAAEDENYVFQTVLFHALDEDDEWDEQEEKKQKELAQAQTAAYQAAGITASGSDYYYKGELCYVFADKVRTDQSSCTLTVNPAGTVSVRIVRDKNNKITGAVRMTEAEVTKLLGSMDGLDAKSHSKTIPVHLKTAKAGETVCLGEYKLSLGDKIRYDILVKAGNGIHVYFAKDGQKNPIFWSVHNLRQQGEPLKCTADFTVSPPAEPGTYRLFLKASDGTLKNVTGSISIKPASAD